jgi:hypothetical protein
MRQPRYEIVCRDDNLFQIGHGEGALGPFETRAFALQIANGHQPAPAPVAKFRRLRVIREVLDA